MSFSLTLQYMYLLISVYFSKLPGYQMGPAFQKAMFEEYYSNFFFYKKTSANARDKMLHGPQLYAKVGDKIKLGTNIIFF